MLEKFYSRQNFVVYEYKGLWAPQEVVLPEGMRWEIATRDLVCRLFSDNESIAKRNIFLSFLEQGYRGVIIYKDDSWVTHSWMSLPGKAPIHLPKKFITAVGYWLFYSHTRADFRKQGTYKASLKILLNLINDIEHNKKIKVYADSSVDNIGARHTLLSIGLIPSGYIYTTSIRLPKTTKSVIWGSWDKQKPHLPMSS